MAARSIYVPHAASAVTMKALALRVGLVLANEIGCNRLYADSDCLEVIGACLGQQQWYDQVALVPASCLHIAYDIGVVKFIHCHRETNEVAHRLARICYIGKI